MRWPDKLLIFLLVALLLGFAFLGYRLLTAPRESPDVPTEAIDTNAEPLQKPAVGIPLPIRQYGRKRVIFTPVAEYKISGVLASKHPYRGGLMNYLAPWDYALGWGMVPGSLPWLKFSQSGRFARFKCLSGSPVDCNYVGQHMSNNHLVPANNNVRRALGRTKKGAQVRLEGYLINILVSKKGRIIGTWNTSQVRTDVGMGACEIIYVTRLRVGDKIYE